jgi:hypothetical protein
MMLLEFEAFQGPDAVALGGPGELNELALSQANPIYALLEDAPREAAFDSSTQFGQRPPCPSMSI